MYEFKRRNCNITACRNGLEVDPLVTTVSHYNTCHADGLTAVHFDATDAAFVYTSTFSWRDANCPDYEQHSAMHPVNYDVNYLLTTNYGDLNGKLVQEFQQQTCSVLQKQEHILTEAQLRDLLLKS
ncbi:MAG: hypothetical protein IPG09_01310 [Ignavibacteria bacterium]|nr:hypothetical protein [Ignavibacteria bacterium]